MSGSAKRMLAAILGLIYRLRPEDTPHAVARPEVGRVNPGAPGCFVAEPMERRRLLSSALVPSAAAHSTTSAPNSALGTALALIAPTPPIRAAVLHYDWTPLLFPPGAAAPTFSQNNDAAARNTTANVNAPGTYLFLETATDSAGSVVATGTVSRVVSSVPTSLKIYPTQAVVGAGQFRQFEAGEFDQFGDFIKSIEPKWTVAGGSADGSIDTAGMYFAPSDPAGTYDITATYAGLAANAFATVPVTSPQLTATQDSQAFNINLSWSVPTTSSLGVPPTSNASGFDLFRETNNSGVFTEIAVGLSPATRGSDAGTYTDANVSFGDTYIYSLVPYEFLRGRKILGAPADSGPVTIVGTITASPQSTPILVNTGNPVLVQIPFSDSNPSPSESATFAWGDGTTSAGALYPAPGSHSATVAAAHTYQADGVYKVTVTITDGRERPSISTITVEMGTVPDAPTSVSAEIAGDAVTINWSPPTAGFPPTGYNVWGSTDGGLTFYSFGNGTVPSDQTSQTDTGLPANLTYKFYVTAVNDFGESAPSATATALPPPQSAIPGAPVDATASYLQGGITLSWDTTDDLAGIFCIYASQNGGPYSKVDYAYPEASGKQIDDLGYDADDEFFSNLTPGASYTFYVVGVVGDDIPGSNDLNIESNPSNITTPVTAPSIPDAPKDLTVKKTKGGLLELDWKDPDPSLVSYYNIYQGAASSSGGTEENSYGSTDRPPPESHDFSLSDIDLPAGTPVQFYVTAENVSGESAPSNTYSGTYPYGASNLRVTPQDDGSTVALSWTPDQAATGYLVARESDQDIALDAANVDTPGYTDHSPTVVGVVPASSHFFTDSASDLAGSLDKTAAYTYIVEPYYSATAPATVQTDDYVDFNADANADDFSNKLSALTATSALGSTTARLRWSYQGIGPTTFEVEEMSGTQPGSSFFSVGTATRDAFDVPNLNPDVQYTFRIRADNPDSTFSHYAQVVFHFHLPAAPSLSLRRTSGSDASDQIAAAWSGVPSGAVVELEYRGGPYAGSGWNSIFEPADFNNTPLTGVEGAVLNPGVVSSGVSSDYEYRISYTDSAQTSAWSAPQIISYRSPAIPSPIPRVTARSTSDSITLSWHAAAGSNALVFIEPDGTPQGGATTGYPVRADSKGNVSLTLTQLAAGSISPGTTYAYSVWLEEPQVGGTSSYTFKTGTISTTGHATPTAPDSITAFTNPNNNMLAEVRWRASISNGITSYMLQRSDGTDGFVTIADLPPDTTFYVDTLYVDTAGNFDETYRVIAVDGQSQSAPSATATAKGLASALQ